ncbi:MAG: hypothetical protein IKG21_03685 [Atopobiaceae bacterium]|nr:hypothetical protein [Atopobiaceae bacterium]
MRFVALSESVAAFVPTGPNREADPGAALNKLMTVNSWRVLIDFLKHEGCNDLFAKREEKPLHTQTEFEVDGKTYRNDREFYYADLAGSLKARIDKDASIDYLDALTRDDLLAQGDVYELYIPELLSWREDMSCFLVLATISRGADIPEGMFEDFSFDMYEWDKDDDFDEWLDGYFDSYFGAHGPIRGMSMKMGYWPVTDCGPFWYEGPFNERFGDSYQEDCKEERAVGILGGTTYLGEDASGEDMDFHVIFYDSSRYSKDEACRMFSGLTVANIIDETAQRPVNDGPFYHHYLDEPDFEQRTHFDLNGGYRHPKYDDSFERWQLALVDVAEDAVFNNRVTLCPICGTPIVTKSDYSRIEYCCESHKTIASKRRRQRAHQLYQMGIPIEDAVTEIGTAYRSSVEKWYREASAFVNPAQ